MAPKNKSESAEEAAQPAQGAVQSASDLLNDMSTLADKLSADNNLITATVAAEEESPKDRLSFDVAKRVIEDFAKKNNTSDVQSLVGICKLVQDGGTNTGKPKLTRTINGIPFDLTDLRNIIKVHDSSGTVRKLGKTLRDTIIVIALRNNWPGPLFKELQRLNPGLPISTVDSIYCNEINTDNYSTHMPPRIREALQQREQKLREERPQGNKSKGKNSNKNKKKK